MKLSRKPGSTSQILQVFIRDSSSTTGGGLTGLVYNTASLTAYYHRDTDTTATAISLVTMTVGTFTSGGFKEIDATNMPGWYQLCLPNAVLASGAVSAAVHLKGATNMAPLPIEIDLNSQVNVAFWNDLATVALPLVPTTAGRTLDVSATGEAGIDWSNIGSPTTTVALTGTTVADTQKVDVNTIKTNPVVNAGTITFPANATIASTTNITAGTITTVTNLTNAPTNGDLTATMKASVTTAATAATPTVAAVTGDVGGNVYGSIGGNLLGSIAGSVASVVGAVGSVTGNVGGNVNGNIVGSVASVTAPVTLGTVNSSASNIKKNVSLAGFPFIMTNATTGVPQTGLTITSEVSLNGGAFAATTNAATELSDGWYTIDLAAADVNGNTVALKFSAATANDTDITLITQP
jgi:hypothetical protein